MHALPQGLLDEQLLRVRGRLCRPAGGQERFEPGLPGGQHELGKPSRLDRHPRAERVHDVGHRIADDEVEAFVQQVERRRRVDGDPASGRVGEPGQPPGVHRPVRHLEQVARGPTPDPDGRRRLPLVEVDGVAQAAAEAGHVDVQRRDDRCRRGVAPQLAQQAVGRHDRPAPSASSANSARNIGEEIGHTRPDTVADTGPRTRIRVSPPVASGSP